MVFPKIIEKEFRSVCLYVIRIIIFVADKITPFIDDSNRLTAQINIIDILYFVHNYNFYKNGF